jgi:hypothetical protein
MRPEHVIHGAESARALSLGQELVAFGDIQKSPMPAVRHDEEKVLRLVRSQAAVGSFDFVRLSPHFAQDYTKFYG